MLFPHLPGCDCILYAVWHSIIEDLPDLHSCRSKLLFSIDMATTLPDNIFRFPNYMGGKIYG